MSSMSSGSSQRLFLAVLVGFGLVIALSFPFAIAYDEAIDLQRSGYNDASTVVRMQTDLMNEGGEPVAFESGPGEPVRIGDQTFRASPGNHVLSQVNEEGLCVRVRNVDPEIRSWTYDSADGENPYNDIPGGACGA
jgi:hypothetical protein